MTISGRGDRRALPIAGTMKLMADARQAADTMRAVLEAIERGDLQASKTERARLEGAVAALETLVVADESDPSG